MNVIIVVPVYNEANRIKLDDFAAYRDQDRRISFIFVDDGSLDDTAAMIAGYRGKKNSGKEFELFRLPQNQGKAEAVRQGIMQALHQNPHYVGYWDADLATPLEEIPKFIDILDRNPSIALVMGSRVKLLGREIDRHAWRHYVGRIFATLASLTLRLPVYDTQCGAKMLRVSPEVRQAFSQPFISRWLFDVELIARLCQLHDWGMRQIARGHFLIYEHVLEKWQDKAGSKVNLKAYAKSIWDLWLIFRRYHRKSDE